ncbi:hypothetical protein F5883DRAFT_685314 [Diaporthe sp. PMI_573]|nr:hypothetical protein F5883DRAFT_685314 [Diaporthaceae sp. PMI_573]
MPFRNLDPLTDGAIAAPKPDIYYGSISQQLNPTVRNELGHHIAPSAAYNRPIVPNFFLEVKGPDGTPAVMMRQIRHDGAVGARAIHSLQNYGAKEPVYDGKAYTYSSAYQNGHLQLYAHHTTAAPGGQPEYHTSELRDFAMRGSRENFLEGATAFRNARDLAREHRDTFIRHANSKLQVGIAAAEETVHDEQDM